MSTKKQQPKKKRAPKAPPSPPPPQVSAEPSGRPTIYTPELATKVCRRITEGESLRKICEDDAMPAKSTVMLWVAEDREGFSDRYAKSRLAQAFDWAEEIVEIADESNADVAITETGLVIRGEVVARSRLRVDTRKWLLSKVLPKLYGDKLALTGGDGGPIETAVVSDDELKRRAAELTNRITPFVLHTNGNGKRNGNGNGH